MTFDPFKDAETRGYLRNFAGSNDRNKIKSLEHYSFKAALPQAMGALAEKPRLAYSDILGTHKILFGAIYPWAGQDRKATAPDIAITKGGHHTLFAHPEDAQRATDYALEIGQSPKMATKPGEVLGLLAHGHAFLDGNGRTIMTVHYELCYRAEIEIDWTRSNKTRYLAALTEELTNPGRGTLDRYLEPIIGAASKERGYGRILLAMKGLNLRSHPSASSAQKGPLCTRD